MAAYSDLAMRRHGARPFVTDDRRTCTYAEMADLVSARVDSLVISPGDIVAIAPANTIESVIDCLAVWEAGGVIQLVNARLTPAEAAQQAEQAGATAMIRDGELIRETPSSAARASDRYDLALIVATSGTSGVARLVELTWENLLASADASRRHLHHVADDRWLAVLPLFHVGGFMIVVRSMLAGSEMVLRPSFEPGQAATDLQAVTIASLVGSMLPPILEVDSGPYIGLRAVLVGGGPTPTSVLAAASEAGIPVLSTYGMTETASQIATAPLGDGPLRRAVPVPGAEVRVNGDGEIEVRGPMVSRSYVGQPLRQADEWFATGDLGSIDAEGYLRVLGRRDDVIISGGENIMPSDVEAALEEVVGVQAAAVFGVADAEWGEHVVAAVVADVPVSAIEAGVRAHLAGYKVPKQWLVLPSLPRNALGKVDREALRSMVEVSDG